MPQVVPCRLTPVFLLTENRLLREALVRILSKRADVAVVGAVAFAPTVLDQLVTSQAEVVLLDSPSLAFHGPRLVAGIRRMLAPAKIVMIGMERDETTFFRAVRSGVMGYVLKDASALEIVNVVRAVGSGEAVCPSCFSRAIFQCAAQQLAATPEVTAFHPQGLSRREQQLVGDELPQLVSVWRGDLSLVGPRPALFNQDDLVALRTHRGVHRLVPGITGWAQVNGRDELEIPLKVHYDAEYMAAQSLPLDLKILALTLWRVFRAEGVQH